ncbi:MAG: phosphatase PAP2 family protein [Alphaproteobacteria bacterium]|nr:phosphatase PAP2 family protein [Alphaproteobacteria bacterium]MBM3613433.1 phosphatase PAP2 family protein [Alphaproteobacteria bacterium]
MRFRSPLIDRTSLIIAAVLAALTIVCVLVVDRAAAYWVRDLDPVVRAPFMAIRNVGEGSYWLIPSALIALIALIAAWRAKGRRWSPLVATLGRAALFVFTTLAMSSIALHIIKAVVGRARPRMLMREDVYGFAPFNIDSDFSSLPSGHTNTLFAAALALGYLAPRFCVPFLAIALIFSAPRVFAGSHFPGDVLAGIALAVVIAPLIHRWFEAKRLLFVPEASGGTKRVLTVALLKRLWRRAWFR